MNKPVKSGLKILVRTAVLIIILVIAVQSAWASYPCSTRAKPSEGVLLVGELIGTAPYGGNQGNSYAKAWDGDRSTFFDPAEGATQSCYTGVILDGTYILTEVRILPRDGYLERFKGAELQGSNDGENWETIWVSGSGAGAMAFNYIPADKLVNNDGYSMYRYVNRKEHGDVAEIELYGVETDPPVSEEELAAEAEREAAEAEQMALLLSEREEIAQHVLTSPSSYDRMVVILIMLCASGTVLILLAILAWIAKRKQNRK